MIDVKELKTRYEEIRKNIENRYMNVDLDKIISDQEKRAALMQETETLRAKRNENAAKMKGKIEQSLRAELIEEGKRIKASLQEKEPGLLSQEALSTGRQSCCLMRQAMPSISRVVPNSGTQSRFMQKKERPS